MIYEARCKTCAETFNPDSPTDLEHVQRVDGTPCGGRGLLLGVWQQTKSLPGPQRGDQP